MLDLGGTPFDVAVSPHGDWSFVSLGTELAVLSDRNVGPALARTIELSGSAVADRAAGETLTQDGRYLLVADGSGAVVVDVSRAESGASNAVLGNLAVPRSTNGGAAAQAESAIEVATSPDDRFAFVSLEYAGEIAVFDLHAALGDHFRSSGFVGTIELGQAVVGLAISRDGRWLYATSELAAGVRPSPQTVQQLLQGGARGPYGTVSVIDLRRAETKPTAAVVATAPAGCGTVRVAVSPDGRVVWVTARESDALLAFSAATLRADPHHALLARVRVGEAPVGLALFDDGRYVAVANSNRFTHPGAAASLTIVDANAALAGKAALLGTVPTGMFPRELAIEPDGATLLVTNFASGQLERVTLPRLP